MLVTDALITCRIGELKLAELHWHNLANHGHRSTAHHKQSTSAVICA
jgi:hypothetical protein